MSEQAEALRLADEHFWDDEHCVAAAAELRRQHQEIQNLKKAKEELLEVLSACDVWHRGDAWRISNDPAARTAWEKHRIAIQATIFRHKD